MEKELQRLDAKMKTMSDTILKLKEEKLKMAKELADLKKEQRKSSGMKKPKTEALATPVPSTTA